MFIDKLTHEMPDIAKLVSGTTKMRVHADVIALAWHLAVDPDKLQKAAGHIFWPSYSTWIEWSDDRGDIAFYFDGREESVTNGVGMFICWERSRPAPDMLSIAYDLPGYSITPLHRAGTLSDIISQQSGAAQLRPVLFAVLALINSPKLIRHKEADVSRINKKRLKLRNYPFHPHREVVLNVDKTVLNTVAGTGKGGTAALHFVRSHLRFRLGQYELVSPHWRGDCQIGIIETEYSTSRQNSRWKD